MALAIFSVHSSHSVNNRSHRNLCQDTKHTLTFAKLDIDQTQAIPKFVLNHRIHLVYFQIFPTFAIIKLCF